jgi:hypothetical protein
MKKVSTLLLLLRLDNLLLTVDFPIASHPDSIGTFNFSKSTPSFTLL